MKEEIKSKKTVLLAPVPDVNVESRIPMFTVVEISDAIKAIADDVAVITIEPGRTLQCMIDYADLFGVDFAVLQGFPGAIYSEAFNQQTWSLDRVSYDTLIADVVASERVEALKKSEDSVIRAKSGSTVLKTPKNPDDDIAAPDFIPEAFDVSGRE